MPNLKSSRKRMKTDSEKRVHNASAKSAMKTSLKKVAQAFAEGKKDLVAAALNDAFSHLDRCAKKGIIHKNAANRYKSRLASKVS